MPKGSVRETKQSRALKQKLIVAGKVLVAAADNEGALIPIPDRTAVSIVPSLKCPYQSDSSSAPSLSGREASPRKTLSHNLFWGLQGLPEAVRSAP